jgi:tRNA threonylcarbamoyl adenosine modification protein YjeE
MANTPDPVLTLRDAEATSCLGRMLAAELRAGDTLLLDGPIGSGKTHLARAVIQALLARDGHHEEVPSPTFTVVQRYDTAAGEVLHADLYRLTDPRDLDDIGLTDALGRAICLIEWPALLGADTPSSALRLAFSARPDPDSGRHVTLSSAAGRWDEPSAALARRLASEDRAA